MADVTCGRVATLVVITCALAIAACGASIHPPGSATELKVSECMRSHGVPNFPDPSAGAGGFNLNGTGINPQSPAFQSAHQTCFKSLSAVSGPFAQHPTAHAMANALQVSECMRRHGVSGFPDPTEKAPSIPIHPRYSVVEDLDGAVLAVPSTIDPSSPAFKQAATACHFS